MFAVQCFYAHRVWIITAKNRVITGIISTLATTSFACGMILSGLVLHTRNPEILFGTKWSQLATIASAACDFVITGTIWWFLRPERTDNVRSKSSNYIKSITRTFIHMGLFSCLVSISMVVLYQLQDGHFYIAAPGAVIGKSYMNSMMAVLNARKSIREREQLARNAMVVELPTLHTIR
ncbi:uncharacterized protein EDB91DRAFT_220723 [Suillus paluster]|uniref:uncharacterized protein n=1 Tax=Suillus paluster TaxID=48578 RepID=UPI001B875A77|nr:uncharacterized protein EDB91DRAFT_220723 [Suillus paluster]KAG1743679.1 hypothetical protein EDB91DRAFT_220723 [Suillus paluster]